MTERRSRRRRADAAHAPNHERWLVSYADFITLLFAFFTTMYAISTVDARKLATVVDSMQTAFASRQTAGGSGSPVMPPSTPAAPAPLVDTERQLADHLRTRLSSAAVDVAIDHRGVVVSLREAGSFSTGRADLSEQARRVLRDLVDALGTGAAMPLRVEGHTDDVPIRGGRFASNWELSTARATSVVAFLVQEAAMEPRRLSAAGYAEFHPRVQNLTDADRATNRRVDIVILNEETAATEEPAPRTPSAPGARPGPTGMPTGRVFAG
ncbi:MAG: OmpA family protein [Acidobacteria bacterium]|nr:OmpA family protein [Acidobacteriota bacterium]